MSGLLLKVKNYEKQKNIEKTAHPWSFLEFWIVNAKFQRYEFQRTRCNKFDKA